MSEQSHRVLEKTKMCFSEAVTSNTRDVLVAHLLMNPGAKFHRNFAEISILWRVVDDICDGMTDNASKLEQLKPAQFATLCSYMKDGGHFTMCLNSILEVKI